MTHLSKPQDYTTPRMSHYVNHGLWLLMMCACRVIDRNTCVTLVWDTGSGVGSAGVGQWVYGKSLSSSRFRRELAAGTAAAPSAHSASLPVVEK